jgi:hypothetical protein
MDIECPKCRRCTVDVITSSTGDKAKCSTCGWEGPKCYAQMWDPNNPKCKGGADPTQWGGNSHVRRPCAYERTCGETQDRRQKASMLQPMNALTRPWQTVEVKPHLPVMPHTPPTYPPQYQPIPIAPSTAGVNLQVRHVYPTPQTQQAPKAQQAPVQYPGQYPGQYPIQHYPPSGATNWASPNGAQVFIPQNYVAASAQVPAYLTVPEPYDQGLASMFINSCLRAALKGALHTASNLLDHFPWGKAPAPPING